jgi:hypothetical protein
VALRSTVLPEGQRTIDTTGTTRSMVINSYPLLPDNVRTGSEINGSNYREGLAYDNIYVQ